MELQRELAICALYLCLGRVASDSQDFVIVTLAHARLTFGHFHHRRPQQAVAKEISAAELFDDLSLSTSLGGFVRDGLVIVRVEIGAQGVNRAHASFSKNVIQLAMNELDAAAIGLTPLRPWLGLQRSLEIVDERQQFFNDVSRCRFSELLTLTIRAFAEIVEL